MNTDLVKWIIGLMITIGLTIFDMVSDIILAVDYASTGKDDWWFALTLTFFLLPVIPLFFLLLAALVECTEWRINFNIGLFFHLWKQFECAAESGPQLILQLYILAVSSMNLDGTNDAINFENTTSINNTIVPEDFTTTSEWNFVNTTVIHSTTDAINGISSIDEAFTLILQILVIISALFSISWSSVTLKKVDDYE